MLIIYNVTSDVTAVPFTLNKYTQCRYADNDRNSLCIIDNMFQVLSCWLIYGGR